MCLSSISRQRWFLPFFQKKGKRGRDRGSRESEARERMAEELWGLFHKSLNNSEQWNTSTPAYFTCLYTIQTDKRWWFLPDLKRVCFVSHVKESRDGRVDSWRSFQAQGKKSKEKKNRSFLKPPKVKMEQRDWCSALGLFTWPSLHAFCVRSSDGLLDVLQTSHPGRPVFLLFFFFFFYTSVRRSTWAIRLLEDKQTCTCSEMSGFFCCFFFPS